MDVLKNLLRIKIYREEKAELAVARARQHLRDMDTALDDGYRAMAADKAREAEAQDWCNSLVKDMEN